MSITQWFKLFLITLISLAFAMIPETIMYFLWQLIKPGNSLERLITLGIFWFLGAGICVIFLVLGLALWTFLIEVFRKTKYRF